MIINETETNFEIFLDHLKRKNIKYNFADNHTIFVNGKIAIHFNESETMASILMYKKDNFLDKQNDIHRDYDACFNYLKDTEISIKFRINTSYNEACEIVADQLLLMLQQAEYSGTSKYLSRWGNRMVLDYCPGFNFVFDCWNV